MFVHNVLLLALLGIGCYVHCCPNGWIRHDEKCYHFSHDTEIFTAAKQICHDMDSILVEIETAEENAYLGSQAKMYGYVYRIALTDLVEEGTWMWYESKTIPEFTNWGPNEPDSRNEDENCAHINLDGTWADIVCHDNRHYICEKDYDEEQIIG